MLAVVIAGVGYWLLVVAVRVEADSENQMLYHCWTTIPDEQEADDENDEPKRNRLIFPSFYSHEAPFWPRYWLRLTGHAWPGGFACHSCGTESDTRANLLGPKYLVIPRNFTRLDVYLRARAELKKAKEQSL